MLIRKATAADTAAIVALFDAIHTEEEAGRTTTGWLRDVYPTVKVVETGLACADLYVMEEEGTVVATCRINAQQVDCYFGAPWLYDAAPEQVLVLHTLVVDPQYKGRGYGTAFIAYYEEEARRRGCAVVRIDTNARNEKARRLYANLGYREADIVPTVFNGIPGVGLVLLEKKL